MSSSDTFETNRVMWNETAAIHERSQLPGLLAAVGKPGFCTFDSVERRIFDELGICGKAVAQLSCNNARELISVKKAGAGRCVGFDISEAFIEQGRRLVHAADVDVELVRTNVYDISGQYSECFDVVCMTVGVLGWLPDMERLFAKVHQLLRPNGVVFVYEMHPVLFLYDEESTSPEDPRISRSYFQKEPVRYEGGTDYFDPSSQVKAPSVWHQHTMGHLISSVLGAGLLLERFQEYAHDISMSYAAFAKQECELPMCFSLLGRKVC